MRNIENLCQHTLFVVNNDGQDDLPTRGVLTQKWTWITAPNDWIPSNIAEADQSKWSAILIVAQKYQEENALELCKAIRQEERVDNMLLLVAINIFQMPLVSKIRQIPNATYIFTPIVENELMSALKKAATESRSLIQARKGRQE